jgi:transglutaminase-like putative cysteine protease
MEQYLAPTGYIDSEHPDIIDFASSICKPTATDKQKAIDLYIAVRDGIRYNPYSIEPSKQGMKASTILKKGHGYCVAKAVVLVACARTQKIPARLGFADVRNHLNTKRLAELMGTDIFTWHGYAQLYLNKKWVKATPAFNIDLCTAFNITPLDFDGIHDSIFHPFDTQGNRHMEYIKDHGTYSDLPWDTILKACQALYPKYFETLVQGTNQFITEALTENQ